MEPEPEPEPDNELKSAPISPVASSSQVNQTLDIPAETRSAAEIDRWSALIDNLDLNGLARQLARNSVLEKQEKGYVLWVREEWQHLLNDSVAQTITQALQDNLDLQLTEVALKNTGQPTPFEIQQAIDAKRLADAKSKLAEDPLVQALQQNFGAELIDDSVQPL